jgi:nucleotide-binding universal stress UspA family protein
MFETVLIPLDGSELAEAAIEPAREIAEKFGSTVLLVRSIDPVTHLIATQAPGVFESPASAEANVELMEQVVDAERDEATKYLEAIRARLGGRSEYLVIEGQAGDAIVKAAKDRNADLIVMSSHGRGGLGRVLFGSVADHVLQNNHVPTLLIRHRDK